MENWQILAVVGVALLILEIFVPSFVMAPAGVAFLATAALSPFLGLTATIGALAASLLATYTLSYFLVWPRLQSKGTPRTNVSAMVGKVAVVSEAIRPDGSGGYVKLYGDTWRALSAHPFEVGQQVVILEIVGNKVVVGPLVV